MSITKGAEMLDAFRVAVSKAVAEHILAGRASPIYDSGMLVAVKLKTASLYGGIRKPKKNIWRFWRS